MRWTPRRRCLPLLLLVTEAALGTDAVALSSRNSSDPLEPDRGGKDVYYVQDKGFYCQKCPAGTYVAEECKEQNSSGQCLPCEDGKYVEYPNNLQWCRYCRTCRDDQVELSPCQAVRNRVCACKDGTFCPPDHPCEMCQKCRPGCPEGQVLLADCTPYSDLQCGPATMDSGSSYLWIIIPVVLLSVIGLLIWKCWSCSPGDERNLSRRPYSVMGYVFRKLTWCRRVNRGTRDNNINEFLQAQPRPRPLQSEVMVSSESVTPRSNLVPVPGKDPIQVLRLSFYTFAEKIHMNDWKKFGRSLNLQENDLVLEWTDEAFFQMLDKWLNRVGSRASVNTLLQTLDQLHLSGVADIISSTLVQNELFQYETS